MKADSPVVTYVYEAVNYGGSNDPNVVVIHDVECPLKGGYARSLIGPAWFGGPAGTSTHYLVGPDDICQGVPENRIAWHCGTGNRGTLAIEQCGYARFSASDWDTPDGLIQQENVSKLLADINRRRPLIRLRTLSDSELLYAWRNPGTPGGVSTHNQMRRAIKGTNHHDPYNSEDSDIAYPLVRVINRAVAIRGGTPVDPPVDPPVESRTDEEMALNVVRGGEIDYAWSATTGVFYMIRDLDHYIWLLNTGIIKTPHGDAPRKSPEEIEFIRQECARSADRLADQGLHRVEGFPKAA